MEVLKAQGTSRVDSVSWPEPSPAFHCELATKPEIHSMPCALAGEDVSKTEVSPAFEELPPAETSKSEVSLGSDESSTLEDTSVSEACPAPREPSNVEFSAPETEAVGSSLPDHDLSWEAPGALRWAGSVPEDEQPQLAALGLLPSLHDPFAEVEAKLARLSSAVGGAEAPQAATPRLPTQVADVTRDVVQKGGRQSLAGVGWGGVGTQVTGAGAGGPVRSVRGLRLGGRRSLVSAHQWGNRDGDRRFAGWAPVLLMEGHPLGGFAELSWLH